MLRARYPNDLSVDAKGRLQLPNRIREELGIDDGETMEFHVGVLTDPCIVVHSEEQQERFLEAFEFVTDDTRKGRKLKSMLHGRFVPVTTDRTGRINLSEKMRQKAAIEKDVVLVSMRDRLEIWGVETYEALNDENEAEFDEGLEAAFERMGESRRAAAGGHADD